MKKLLIALGLLTSMSALANPMVLANLSSCLADGISSSSVTQFAKFPVGDSLLGSEISKDVRRCAYSISAAKETYTTAQIRNTIYVIRDAFDTERPNAQEVFLNRIRDSIEGQTGLESKKMTIELLVEAIELITE